MMTYTLAFPAPRGGGWTTLGLDDTNEKSGTHTQTYNNNPPDSEPQKVSPVTDGAKAASKGPSNKSDQGWIEELVDTLE